MTDCCPALAALSPPQHPPPPGPTLLQDFLFVQGYTRLAAHLLATVPDPHFDVLASGMAAMMVRDAASLSPALHGDAGGAGPSGTLGRRAAPAPPRALAAGPVITASAGIP